MTNDYKVGDFIVNATSKYAYVTELKSKQKKHFIGFSSAYGLVTVDFKSLCKYRPATPEEIKAGHRLNPSNLGELEVLDMVDVPPTTMVVDL